jgi:hypothetical protein
VTIHARKLLEEAISRFDTGQKLVQRLIERNLSEVIILYDEDDEMKVEMED